ncbi:c-type cytochrome [Rhizobium mesoamericanum]|uniref:c-type cytochrome n=1 Tax=Rhizobium mesoamericanum TaxID=1079800 RepID=UPI0004070616|nr:c-type cytochrome [Rhizobium mesoamericanum]
MTRTFLAIATLVALSTIPPFGSGEALAQDAVRKADLHRGEVVAAQGLEGVPACAQCHAFNGASDGSGAFPRLTGQPASYLVRQMHDFASSKRDSAIMSPIAGKLSAGDTDDVSAYYAAAGGSFPPLATGDAALVEKGKAIARVGDATRSLQACNNCHGPDGAGFPPEIPYLAGQYAPYLELSLHMWKEGYRKNSPDVMARVAKQLTDEEIAAVAAYYQQVREMTAAAPANEGGESR